MGKYENYINKIVRKKRIDENFPRHLREFSVLLPQMNRLILNRFPDVHFRISRYGETYELNDLNRLYRITISKYKESFIQRVISLLNDLNIDYNEQSLRNEISNNVRAKKDINAEAQNKLKGFLFELFSYMYLMLQKPFNYECITPGIIEFSSSNSVLMRFRDREHNIILRTHTKICPDLPDQNLKIDYNVDIYLGLPWKDAHKLSKGQATKIIECKNTKASKSLIMQLIGIKEFFEPGSLALYTWDKIKKDYKKVLNYVDIEYNCLGPMKREMQEEVKNG